ncbi:hypothetical protein BDQ94DRAFT_176156 [Aspergillus welwitschiae]|uniref:Bicarbonate transporter-like transmembrane domain-containing protein n=1 Tax=Aspergillus welwitschiae TaxID=1341132 RepID=A0A3F3PK89_9EURO|nr:hypothetical protein BDQ94DRAFT_176156 [Aspergillus welwitschiae]RDH26776.1 hypothetical protein BDQ94DRAFT_176156 [Aspergillus welwitschiae]
MVLFRRLQSTDSLTVYETTLRAIAIEGGEGAEIRRPVVEAKAVVEQRISHFVMGLGIIGTMTGPLLIVLHTMPTAVFAGVFFNIGWGSIQSNGMVQKAVFLMQENHFVQQDEPLLSARKRKVLLFTALQGTGVAATVAISQTIAAIGFPVLIILLIPLRVWTLPKWLSEQELDVLDDLTADSSASLVAWAALPSSYVRR